MKCRSFLFVITLSIGLIPGVILAEGKNVLNFGIISTESAQNLRTVWNPFLVDMGKKLNMEVKGYFAPDYAGIIQAMRFNKVDIAWYGNKSAMEAVDRTGAEIFVQTVDVNGNPGYWGTLIAHKNSALEFDDILKCGTGLTFGNGDPNSTSGFLIPGYYVFSQNDIDPKKCYKRVLNSNHETNALAVANKQVDFATNNTETLDRIKMNFPKKHEQIKVIWKSPLIPSDPIAWRKNLPQEMKDNIKSFFLDYGVKGDNIDYERKVLAGLQWAPFRESNNDQLLPIRQIALVKKQRKIENDEKYSAAEKERLLSEIERELSELQQNVAMKK